MASPPSVNGNRAAPAATSGSKVGKALTLTLRRADGDSDLKNPFTVVGWTGTEAMSQLYLYELEFVTDLATPLAFDKVLGKPATIEVLGGGRRHGIVGRLTEEQPTKTHARYRAEIT